MRDRSFFAAFGFMLVIYLAVLVFAAVIIVKVLEHFKIL